MQRHEPELVDWADDDKSFFQWDDGSQQSTGKQTASDAWYQSFDTKNVSQYSNAIGDTGMGRSTLQLLQARSTLAPWLPACPFCAPHRTPESLKLALPRRTPSAVLVHALLLLSPHSRSDPHQGSAHIARAQLPSRSPPVLAHTPHAAAARAVVTSVHTHTRPPTPCALCRALHRSAPTTAPPPHPPPHPPSRLHTAAMCQPPKPSHTLTPLGAQSQQPRAAMSWNVPMQPRASPPPPRLSRDDSRPSMAAQLQHTWSYRTAMEPSRLPSSQATNSFGIGTDSSLSAFTNAAAAPGLAPAATAATAEDVELQLFRNIQVFEGLGRRVGCSGAGADGDGCCCWGSSAGGRRDALRGAGEADGRGLRAERAAEGGRGGEQCGG